MVTTMTVRRFVLRVAATCMTVITIVPAQATEPLQPVPDSLSPQTVATGDTIIPVEPISVDDGKGVVTSGVACCEAWSPVWSIQGGTVLLRRDAGPSNVFANGTPGINLGEMNFPYEAGPMISATRHGIRGSDFDLQLQYFGVNSFDATSVTTGATALRTDPLVLFSPREVTTTFRSRLDSTELNLRENTNSWINAFLGVRWIELGEDMFTDFGTSSHHVNVNNHLYGMQVGADAKLASLGWFTLEGFTKLGVYYNDADQTTSVTDVFGVVSPINATGPQTAVAAEVGLIGVVKLNDAWSVRGGYQLLWLDGVALPGDQISSTNLATGAADLETGNTALFHGFVTSIQFAW